MNRALAWIMLIILCQCPLFVFSNARAAEEVELWHYFESSHDKDMIEERVDEYNLLQDRVHITANYVSRQEMMTRYSIGAISGRLPDIGMVDSPDMAYFISLGTFLDITDTLGGWDELESFYPGALSSCMDGAGRLYGIPHNSSCLCLAVNLDLLAAAGYDHMPQNRAELSEMAAAMTDAESGVYGLAVSCIDTEEGTFQLLPWLCADGNGLEDLTAPSAAEGLGMLGELMHNGYMSSECLDWNQADVWQSFCRGEAAMAECGTWHLSQTDEIADGFRYDFCLLPTGEDGSTTSIIGGENIGICAGCVDEVECVAFIKWLCSRENVTAWALGAGKLPPRSDCEVEYPYEEKGFDVFRQEMRYAQARGPHAAWPNISGEINRACQFVFIEDASPAEALARAAEAIDAIIKN